MCVQHLRVTRYHVLRTHLLRLLAHIGARGNCCAQHIARGQVAHAKLIDDLGRLSALAATRGADQDGTALLLATAEDAALQLREDLLSRGIRQCNLSGTRHFTKLTDDRQGEIPVPRSEAGSCVGLWSGRADWMVLLSFESALLEETSCCSFCSALSFISYDCCSPGTRIILFFSS